MRWEYTIAWDGDPSMGGEPHRQRTGEFNTYGGALRALDNLPSAKARPERNYRIERRRVTVWEVVK